MQYMTYIPLRQNVFSHSTGLNLLIILTLPILRFTLLGSNEQFILNS